MIDDVPVCECGTRASRDVAVLFRGYGLDRTPLILCDSCQSVREELAAMLAL